MNIPELVFQSSFTMDEIEENFKNVDIFGEIMEGLQEALEYEKDKGTSRKQPAGDKKKATA